jgi:hypothetical protein
VRQPQIPAAAEERESHSANPEKNRRFLFRAARFHFFALGQYQVRLNFFLKFVVAAISAPERESHDSLTFPSCALG